MLMSTEVGRHKLEGPSAAWTRPSSVQGCVHKVNCVARKGPPEEPLGMSHSSPSALGYSVSRKLMSTNFCTH